MHSGRPVSWTDGPDPRQTDARWHRGGLGRPLGGGRDISLRPLGATAGRVLDRHPAADGVGLDPHGDGVRLHPDRRPRPLPADGRQGGLLPDRLGRQRPGHRTAGAELLRRALRSEPSVRPRLPAAVPRRHAEGPPGDPDLAAQLRRAVPRADRHRRSRLRGPLPSPRPVLRLVAEVRDDQRRQPPVVASSRSSTTSPAARPTAPRPRRCGTSTTARQWPRPRSRTASVPAPTTCWRSTGPTAT